MRIHSTIGAICLLLSGVCLAGAYILGGYWQILLSIPVMLVLWIATRGRSAFWLATSLLAVYVLLAVVGMIIRASMSLVVVGCIFALTAWDLADFSGSTVRGASPTLSASLEKSRLQSLAVMVGVSLLLIGASYGLRLRLPFGVIAVLVLLATACIAYAVHRLGNSAAEIQKH